MITRNMDYYNLDMIINPIKSRIKQIFLIRGKHPTPILVV